MTMNAEGWLQLELRHLLALQVVAREGSFAAAAEALGYTQSAISQQIAALERTVGHRLIERPGGRRRVFVTEAGQTLLRHADEIVAHVHAAAADLRELSAGRSGRLRVGTYQSVGARILPAVVRAFADAHPEVTLEVRESANDDELYGWLERAQLELSFGLLPPPAGPFEALEVLPDPYVLLVACDSQLADRGEPPTLPEVASLPLIGFTECRQERWLEAQLHAQATQPRWAFRSDDNATIQAMAAAGVGAALVPRLTVDPGDRRTVAIAVGELFPPRRLGLVWHSDRTLSPAARAFMAIARSACADYARAVGGADAVRVSSTPASEQRAVLPLRPAIHSGSVSHDALPPSGITATRRGDHSDRSRRREESDGASHPRACKSRTRMSLVRIWRTEIDLAFSPPGCCWRTLGHPRVNCRAPTAPRRATARSLPRCLGGRLPGSALCGRTDR
jgi:DNA-binding transcriptional LysR family regulator